MVDSKKITEIYADYEVQPYISPERDLEAWLANPKPVPKRNMNLLADGLLAGDIILLWRIRFGTFTTESVFPKYFEYSYGIDAPKRLRLLIERDFAEVLSAFDSLKHVNATAKKNLLKSKSYSSKIKVILCQLVLPNSSYACDSFSRLILIFIEYQSQVSLR